MGDKPSLNFNMSPGGSAPHCGRNGGSDDGAACRPAPDLSLLRRYRSTVRASVLASRPVPWGPGHRRSTGVGGSPATPASASGRPGWPLPLAGRDGLYLYSRVRERQAAGDRDEPSGCRHVAASSSPLDLPPCGAPSRAPARRKRRHGRRCSDRSTIHASRAARASSRSRSRRWLSAARSSASASSAPSRSTRTWRGVSGGLTCAPLRCRAIARPSFRSASSRR